MDVLAQDAAALKKIRVDGWNLDPSSHPVRTEPYPGLFNGDYSPTDAVLDKAESPLKLFIFFMPPKLWIKIASESNRYYNQHLNERVDRMYQKKVAQDDEVTRDAVLLAETKRHKKIKAKEILHCIGLLVARMLCPHKHRFADHWANDSVGAVPKGTFGRYMSKARFGRVMQILHFTDNANPRAETDRAWKLRLQRYSLQLSVGFRKYYKTIFMGLVDMAIVNAFIVYREGQKQRGEPTADHAEFLRELQAQLLQVTAADLIDESPQPDPTNPSGQGPTRHKLVEFPEWVQIREGVRKRPQHQCKVCSIRKKKVGELRATRFYCETCSDGSRRTGKSGHRLASGATFKCARLARSAVVAVREDGGSNEEAEQEEQEDVQQEEPQEDVEEVEPQVVVVQGDAEQEAVGQEGEEEEVAVVGTSAKEAEE
ncbi:hypothetical protein PR003_g25560 [Phytophthora rubi]|uniref:PiggyBac transposable element-derived protein domain-containing protein n=1 Tax=Phytophthora rubi TaxID=129364 RepID=A0A6A4CE50_9STRA|nr:hypothetical protein PR003_g25560 [Phytophthora rubi]